MTTVAHSLKSIAGSLKRIADRLDPQPSTAPNQTDGLAEIKSELAAIKNWLVSNPPVSEGEKQWYTVAEVAARTNLENWTIRQACNKGRIAGAKKLGDSRQWRIPHNALVTILNEGLRAASEEPVNGRARLFREQMPIAALHGFAGVPHPGID
jgi:excisionase family DNA binding protein